METMYVAILPKETGQHIRELAKKKGYSVRDIQKAMGFENPQAVYKWLSGKSLPSLDNFVILSRMLGTSIDDILIVDGDVFRYKALIGYILFSLDACRTPMRHCK